jgi:dTDP-4-dehydrorhamnose reductase
MARPWLPYGERILLTGATGQVGAELLKLFSSLGEVVAPLRSEMDLADAASVRNAVRSAQPRWIVNPGAYTAVDRAESESELAHAINSEAVKVIGEEAQKIGAGVIHLSTDYVFDGAGITPYKEDDATNPVSIYGASKLAGERALAGSGAPHLIFRTSGVYGGTGKNFLLTILRLASERDVLRIVADQHGAPTWSRDLARMIVHVIERCEQAAEDRDLSRVLSDVGGIYHAAGSGETTWFGFANEAVRLQQERNPYKQLAMVQAISTSEYPTPAKRPANSRLDCGKLADRFGWSMMDWKDSLESVLSELSTSRELAGDGRRSR